MYYLLQCFLFLFCFTIPTIIQMFLADDSIFIAPLLCVSLVTGFYFTLQEYNQFIDNYDNYWKEFWNYLDISVFIIFYFYFCMRINDWRSFVPSQEFYDRKLE